MKTLTLFTQQLNQKWRVAFAKHLQRKFAHASGKTFSDPGGLGPLANRKSASRSVNFILGSQQINQQLTTNQEKACGKNIGDIRNFVGKVLLKQLSDSPLKAKSCSHQALLATKCSGSWAGCSKSPRSPLALVLAVVSLTSSMGYRFYNQPKLDVGTVAPATLNAPFDATIEDSKTTEAKRKAARRGLVPVLMVDSTVNQQIYHNLQQYIDQLNQARQLPRLFPFTKTGVLSLATQLYLRDCQEWEWRTILATLDNEFTGKLKTDFTFPTSILPNPALTPAKTPTDTALAFSLSPQQQQAVTELEAYRRSTSAQTLSNLLNNISLVRQRYAKARAGFSHLSDSELKSFSTNSVLQLSESDWQATQTGISKVAQRILTQGIPAGLPVSVLQEAVNLHVKMEIPQIAQPLATEILIASLKPNLKEDTAQTRLEAELAAREVKPEIVEVRQGEVIVQAGEMITQTDFVLLDHFGLSRRGISWLGLIGCGVLVSGAVFVVWLVERRFHYRLRQRDHVLILLLSLTAPLLASLGIPYISLPAIGLLVGSFYGSALGITAVGLLTLGVPISLEIIAWEHLLASAAGGMLGSLIAGKLRSREELALLGIAVGLTEGIVYLAVNLILSASVSSIWYAVLVDAALFSLTGLAWSVVALGLSPYLEHLFDLVTPIRLAELANPNRPLLKKLAEQAPGTFQHTLFVATLAEAAAKALGCNVELVRTGTLYHDIGKLHDPQGFIENQMGGPNKHDEINDPYQSAEIIKKHVSEGLVMARRYRLPKAIKAFIPEHQGTILIAYFYHKAQQESKEPVSEANFRYEGPIPQSRETGIVMLADACEAALRSLKDVSYEEALVTVNKIIKSRWRDNQMVDSGLTRAEMPQIAEIFVQVWQQFHHKRIAYPKAAINSKKTKI